MPEALSSQVQVNLPSATGQPYQRADFFQVAYIGTDYVVSCFQLDYQDVVGKQADPAHAGQLVSSNAIPIARLIMTADGFERLRAEMNTVYGRVAAAAAVAASASK
jgi:hypothetical protein